MKERNKNIQMNNHPDNAFLQLIIFGLFKKSTIFISETTAKDNNKVY